MMKMPPVEYETIICRGGLDQITPTLNLKPGICRAALNFECATTGGYARIGGYERLDGRPAPSAAAFQVLTVSMPTSNLTLGITITGATSGATGILIGQTATTFVLTKVTGTFNGTEVLNSGVAVGTQTGFWTTATQKLVAQYKSLAADNYRADIGKPAGSGSILGAFMFGDVKYCFRNNAGGTAAAMFKSTTSGWSAISLGRELTFAQRSAVVTMTIAAPCVVSWAAHGLAANQAITFSTTGALPTGLVVGTTYYVLAPAAGTFTVAATAGGAAITTTGTQSGVHTCTATPAQISAGDTITGSTSGATATVTRAVLRTGAWTNAPTGALIAATVTGAFTSGEAILVGGNAKAQTTAVDVAITLLPSGKFQFEQANFAGSAGTIRVYGCDGVNRGFEWDGTVFVPISTGQTADTPNFVASHKKHLFWGMASSAVHSAPGLPYDYTALSGASEIATGDTVTGLLVQPGAQTTGALAIYNRTNTMVLYGTGLSSWNLVPFNTGTGCIPYTAENMSQSYTLDDRGVFGMTTTLNYGNFEQNALTASIRPFIVDHRSKAACSVLCREKSQYRVYFSDGTGLHLTIVNGQYLGAMPIYYPINAGSTPAGLYNAWSGTASNGDEVILGCGTDGYVYQLDKGASFDGAGLGASFTLNFDSIRSPRMLKRYRKAALEMLGASYAEVEFSYGLGYGSSVIQQPSPATYGANMLTSNWDSAVFDTFFWDASSLTPTECEMGGTAENVAMTFASGTTYIDSYTINSIIIHFTRRRTLR